MKKLIPALFLSSVLAGTIFAEETKQNTAPATLSAKAAVKTSTPIAWTDDMEAAKKQAAKEGKLILVDFSGSDWCGWCVRLDKEVFSTKEFLDGAKDKFVLVFIDSPQDKDRLSDLAKKQNPMLVEEYGIRGFPTVVILDETGKPIAQTGYIRGGPQNYLAHLDQIIKEQETMRMLEKEIRGLEVGSEERVKKIHEVMKDIRAEDQLKHRKMIDEIMAFDADGSAGMRECYPLFTIYLPLADSVRDVSAAICDDACKAYEKTTPEERVNPDMGRKIFVEAASKYADKLRDCLKKINETEKQMPQGELLEWVRELKRQISLQLEAIELTPATPPAPPVIEEGEEDIEGIFED